MSVRYRGTRLRSSTGTKGFTLVEILIAISIFLIVLFAIYSSFESSRATYRAGEQRADIRGVTITLTAQSPPGW